MALLRWSAFVMLLCAAPASAVELYLPNLEVKDALKLIPVPPSDVVDRESFRNTRKLAGTPRWSLARSDNSRAIHELYKDFACGVGIRIREHRSPELSVLLFRTIATGEAVVNQIKPEYKRKRPFKLDSGPLCFALAERRVSSFDYPSGHATTGWLTGLLLAELWPNRSSEILVRAREYGESRVICGVHSQSATEAGQALARALFKMMQQSSSFKRDIEKAKAEIARNEKSSELPDAAECREQAAILEKSPAAK